jgi:hypothetical protein
MPSLVLAQKIVGALKALPEPGQYNESTPTQMNEIIAREITSYLLMNCVVVVNYAGMVGEVPEAIAGPNPIKGVVAPSVPGDAITWLDTLGHNIAIGFITQAGVVRPLSPHISLQVPNDRLSTFIPVGNCKEIHDSPDPCLAWWTKVAEGIFMMINTQIPKIPSYPASLAGTGIATVTKLVVV